MKDFQLLIYSTPTEDMKVDVVLKDENIWATQKAMAALFGVQIPDISKHINNVFDAGELSRSTTVSKMETVVQRGFRLINTPPLFVIFVPIPASISQCDSFISFVPPCSQQP